MATYILFSVQQARGKYGNNIAQAAAKQLDVVFIEMVIEIILFAIALTM